MPSSSLPFATAGAVPSLIPQNQPPFSRALLRALTATSDRDLTTTTASCNANDGPNPVPVADNDDSSAAVADAGATDDDGHFETHNPVADTSTNTAVNQGW